MRRKSFIKQKAFILVAFLVFVLCNQVLATEDPIYSLKLSGIQEIVPTTSGYKLELSITDYHSSNIETEVSVKNFFEMYIDEDKTSFIQSDFTFSVTLNITYTLPNNTVQTLNGKVLTVDYKKGEGRKFNSKDRFSFEGATSIKCVIVSIDNHGGTYDPREFITLRSGIVAVRDYIFNCSSVVSSLANESAPTTPFDEIEISWGDVGRSTHYDIEWAWIDNESQDQYKVSGNFQADLIFKNNSTSVTLDKAKCSKMGNGGTYHYFIPTIYDGSGYIFYRVRPVNIKESGQVVVGNWNANSGTTPLYFQYTGHENNLNWQATTSFAEEGKRKTVIQYFDGSLRSRQTVTKDNETKNTIIAETFYDHQGRPAIQVLPAPTLNGILKYVEDFNQFESTSGVTDLKDIYDTYTGVNLCSTPAPKLSTNSGAALYYSANNPEHDPTYTNSNIPNYINKPFNQFIPEANGYVYTETRYTPDNTGRISVQGGVGSNHRLGEEHDTRYYYGSASQNVLDALFGTEAGDASHYFKTMVKDANGQFSVSYVDMNGKTVATALAGDAPNNMQSLASNIAGPEMTEILLDNNTNIIKGNSIESSKTITVAKDNSTYKLSYNLTPRSLYINKCAENNVEYNCKYDLFISITDACGGSPVFERTFLDITNKTLDETETVNNEKVNHVTLNKGEYNIYKKLSVNQESLKNYLEDYVNSFKNPSCSTFNTINLACSTAMASLNTHCKPTCATCSTSVGTQESFRTKFMEATHITSGDMTPALEAQIISAYQIALKQCDEICNPSLSKLANIRKDMLLDVTPPDGQYAYLPQPPTTFVSYDCSIFKNYGNPPIYNFFPYQIPFNPDGTAIPKPFYQDEHGNVDKSILDANGSVTPDMQLFADKFNADWAAHLLPYHPEYKKLILAETTLKSSYDFDDAIGKINTYAEAFSAGYINPASNKYLIPTTAYHDPFFQLSDPANNMNSVLGALRILIAANLTAVPLPITISGTTPNPFPIWKVFHFSIFHRNDVNNLDDFLNNTTTPLAPSSTLPTVCMQDYDKLWQLFKAYYLSKKEILVNTYLDYKGNSRTTFNAVVSPKKYRLHFDDPTGGTGSIPGIPVNVTTGDLDILQAATNTAIDIECETNCRQYTDRWKAILNSCPKITSVTPPERQTALINAIIEEFVSVCKGGCDIDNPLGSSTKKPSGTYPLNFNDALTKVFTSTEFSDLSGFYLSVDELCNKYMFEDPKPFDKQIPNDNSNSYIIEPVKPDDCLCDKINAKIAPAQTVLGTGYTTAALIAEIASLLCPIEIPTTPQNSKFDEFKYTVEVIYNGCHNIESSPNCNFFATPLKIPPVLQCGTMSQTCISCSTYAVYKGQFKSPYLTTSIYYGVPYTSDATTQPLTEAQIAANEYYAQYLNYQTGFSYDWTRYAQFEKVECYNSSSARSLDTSDNTSSATTYPSALLCASSHTIEANHDDDPCNDFITMALNQAYDQYNTYIAQLADNFGLLYTEKCLEAINSEEFNAKYTSSEYHYTLYYYDQSGNLVKTVPPAGVDNFANYSGGLTQFVANVKSHRTSGTTLVPTHKLETNYRYNSLNQVIAQKTPDAGESHFWYDRLGRLVISQNAKQTIENNYSYTIYDNLGRISEVGQKGLEDGHTFYGQTTTQDASALWNFITSSGTDRTQITRTIYDFPYDAFCNSSPSTNLLCQENLRNRVSHTLVINSESGQPPVLTTSNNWKSATFYSYDIHGNVDILLHSYPTGVMAAHNEFKIIKYDYDLISGKVNQVAYQPGAIDAFYHHYEYDAENRLTNVYTSKDAFSKDLDIFWEKEAEYSYYRHGPLARTVLGQNKVQGIDYAYTLQGWLKGVNSNALNLDYDMGNDGKPTTTAISHIAKDAYGFSLNYFDGDYTPINSGLTTPPFSNLISGLSTPDKRSLYNGNISAMAVNISKLGAPLLYNYKYDQLNRIVAMDAFSGLNNDGNSFTPVKLDDYKERVSYDANGNILSYLRNGAAGVKGLDMDNLTYQYEKSSDGRLISNKLRYVHDNVIGNYTVDIKSQTTQTLSAVQAEKSIALNDDNYGYDKIGNLIKDNTEGIANVEWTVYGKIKKITKNRTISGSSVTTYIEYDYDASGNRISKTVTTGSDIKATTYVRDASGNIMSVYEKNAALNNNGLTQTEVNLYGSSRLGTYNVNVNVDVPVSNTTSMTGVLSNEGKGTTFERGNKYYELTNHLGNVLATVSDKRIQVAASNGTDITGYLPDITNATDYYPFGMVMPGRNGHAAQGGWESGHNIVNGINYPTDLVLTDRYNNAPVEYKATNSIEFTDGFNDNGVDEYTAFIVDGTTTSSGTAGGSGVDVGGGYRYGFNAKENDKDISEGGIDFGARILDTRLGGRFFSIDPYSSKYPFESPYSFAANSPIIAIDQDGKFPVWTHYQMIYENLIAAKVDKKTAHEIALYGSTYTDHPTDWKVMPYNYALAANYMYDPLRLNYSNPDYKETKNSQDDESIASVAIHGMRTWWEDINPSQAVNRALYGGVYKELDGTVIKIKGAYEILNELKGKDISKLSVQEKKDFAQALHTIEDVKVHKGARWISKHKFAAEQIKIFHKDADGVWHSDIHKNEHPDSHEVPVDKKEHAEADAATKDAIKLVLTPK